MTSKHKIRVEIVERGFLPKIPEDVALCLFRIAQEALSNVVKHSRAKQAQVELSGANNELRLRIVDDGFGFDPAHQSVTPGIGLVSMRERLRLVRGTLSVTSAPMRGTEILAEVPLTASASEAQVSARAAGGIES
jgi:signal transduction histidine kinase